jgi:hypothetical protein
MKCENFSFHYNKYMNEVEKKNNEKIGKKIPEF